MSVRVLIAEYDMKLREELALSAVSAPGTELVGVARDGQEAVQLAVMRSPDVAILSGRLPGLSAAQACETLNAVAPGVMTILVIDSKSTEDLEAAMRSGARAVVTRPVSDKDLHKLIAELAEIGKRRESPETLEWRDPSLFPRVIAVTGAKGGVGKSTIAVNLAVILARLAPGKVALVDSYTQFGDVATMFNIRPMRPLSELESVSNELDATIVQDYVNKHPCGVDIFVASTDPLPLDAVSGACFENLLYVLRRMYRYIVVDVPPILHEPTLRLLSHAHSILLIANLFDLTTATDTKRFFDAVEDARIPKENIGIVLNRVSKTNQIEPEDLESLFDCGILASIPNDNRLVSAVNQGLPITVSDGNSPFGRSLTGVAAKVSGAASEFLSDSSIATGTKKTRKWFGG